MSPRIAATLLLAPLTLPAAEPVTLDVAASPPSSGAPQSVVWSPDGARFLYRQGGTVRLYDVASKTEKDLFNTADLDRAAKPVSQPDAFQWENRRVSERTLQWSSDSSFILIKESGDLFSFGFEDNHWTQLTKTPVDEADPKLSPDNLSVAFLRDFDLYSMNLRTRRETRLTRGASHLLRNGAPDWVYPEELEVGSAYWWSPDSRLIAYLQFDLSPIMTFPHADLLGLRPTAEPQRYPQAGTPNPHVRAGIVSARGGNTRWLDTGDDTFLLARTDWLPDSSAVVIQRLNRVQNQLALLSAAAGKNKTETILELKDPAWINIRDDYRFLTQTPRLIWGGEESGFRHLYLYNLDRSGKTQITTGDWEVTALNCVDESNQLIYYTSTEASPLERHLYRIQFDGTGKQKLTAEPGTHAISMAPACNAYIDTHSSLTNPPRRTIHSNTGSELAIFRERDNSILNQYQLLPTDLIHFNTADGTTLHAGLIKPAAFDPTKKYPAIVMVYGGPHAQSVRDSWQGPNWDQALAQRGFVIWELDNRGSGGRGHKFETPLHRRFGKQELSDQLEGVQHLVSMGFVDPNRIGIYGWSYGGYMTLYSLLNSPKTFRAGVAGAPVTDWRQYDTIYTERYLGLPAENEAGYRASSPVHFAERLQSDLLLVHNFEDDNVLFQHTLRMMDALQKANKHYEFLLYPQKSHSVGGPSRKHLLQSITNFFERTLKPTTESPSPTN